MFLYTVRRLVSLVPIVVVVMLITFTLGYFGPIDPVRAVLGEEWEDEARYAEVKKALGLDRPFLIQFLDYMGAMFGGNWGQSLSSFGGAASDRAVGEGRGAGFSGTSTGVREMVVGRLGITAQLSFWALVFLVTFAILLGVLAAVKQNTAVDYTIVTSSIIASSIPAYVIGPVLLIIFVLKIPVFKTVGGWDGMFSRQAILPAIVLAFGPMLVIVRQTRAGIVEVLGKDFVRTARAKGMPERLVVTRHMLRTAMIPVLTSMGLITSGLLTGSLFVEQIFNIPGIGKLAIQTLLSGDHAVFMGVVLFQSLIIVTVNLLTDLLYGGLDPRVTYS
ncbi:MAG: ABC transporter permease [Caldilineaceae bacterium SB0661_bin_32]|uniref:ABC transporter permease n=1 Tax=Caldilineaceae bacterium SB0661_bin_32 TaxID=2605255 RepID=A0A6B1D5D5_9CHLR|nr:ABC transporter permease [Caldilineaceae bacterium SB0661_bin_32]